MKYLIQDNIIRIINYKFITNYIMELSENKDFGITTEIDPYKKTTFTPQNKQQSDLLTYSHQIRLESFHYEISRAITLTISFLALLICYIICYFLLTNMDIANKVFVVFFIGWVGNFIYSFFKSKNLINLNKTLREQVMTEVPHEIKYN